MRIGIRRIVSAKCPFDLFNETGNDWTHFAHLHRRSHDEFRLLLKTGTREVFLYKSRLFHGMPFTADYLVLREPLENGFRQVYVDLKTGRTHYLKAVNRPEGDVAVGIGEFLFDVPDYWRLWPGLFFWLFKRRSGRVTEEDNQMMRERIRSGIKTHPNCAPAPRQAYEALADIIGKDLPEPDVRFEDRLEADLTAPA